MIKKILILMLLLSSLAYTAVNKPKSGCILAQEGKVSVSLQTKGNTNKLFNDVKYMPIKHEGINFRQILVGSKFIVNDKISLKIIDIKANKRVNRKDPRTGTITMQVSSQDNIKDIPMNYTFSNNIMKANGAVNAFDLNSIGFEMRIKAILCSVN